MKQWIATLFVFTDFNFGLRRHFKYSFIVKGAYMMKTRNIIQTLHTPSEEAYFEVRRIGRISKTKANKQKKER